MAKDLRLVKVRAIDSFTKTTRHGQFHGDPLSKRNRHPRVPDYAVDELLAAGKIELLPEQRSPSPASPLPAAEAGHASISANPAPNSLFTMTHKGFGKWLISGPGVPDDVIVKGRNVALQTIADYEAALERAPDDEDAPV